MGWKCPKCGMIRNCMGGHISFMEHRLQCIYGLAKELAVMLLKYYTYYEITKLFPSSLPPHTVQELDPC